MGYLPSIVDETKEPLVIEETKYKDFYFDETTGTFTGQIVEGIQALKGWIYFALKIARYRYPIYSWKYGCELETLIGKSYDDEDYLLSETKRTISDALFINPHIKSVEDVAINKDLDKLNITCNVNTKYGDIYVKI
mgnify:FL=1